MPSGQVYSPTILGVNKAHPWQGARLPTPLEALKSPAMSDERAKKLTQAAETWFQAHRWYVHEAITCEAMDKGDHYGYLDATTSLWVGDTLAADQERIRITVNLTKPVIDQATAMLTQDAPIFRSSAGQPGVSAAAANETARAYLDHTWRFHNLDDLYRGVGRSAFSTGTSFVLLEWDKTQGPQQIVGYEKTPVAPVMPGGVGEGGELVPPPTTDMPSMAAGLGGMPPPPAPLPPPVPIFVPQGELRYRQLMRDQVAFDPTSRVPGGNDGIGVLVKWKESRSRLMETYPKVFAEIPEGDNSSRSKSSEEMVQRTSVDGGPVSGSKQEEETVDVFCWFLRSRPDRARGDRLVFTATKMLEEGENDIYPSYARIQAGELWPSEISPVFSFLADQRENCPWGRARTVDTIPVQHAINGAMSKWVQHAALIANVKGILPTGADIEINDEPGQQLRFSERHYRMTGGKPYQMTTPPQMHDQYAALLNTGRELLEVIVGVNAASMGNAPSSQPSGTLTDKLQKRDDSRIAPIKRSHDNQWARIQTRALCLFREYATGERKLRVVGPDKSVQMKFFDVANLAAGTEVYCINDTSLPRDPQARIMAFMNIGQMLQAAPNEEARRMFLELLRMPEVEEFLQRNSPHQAKAVRNCRLLLLGEGDGTVIDPTMFAASPPPPNCPIPAPWDNALIHKAELERFACSTDYLDRVQAEKKDPKNQNTSPLEQRFVWIWTFFTQRALPPAPSPMAQPGASAGSGSGPSPSTKPASPAIARAA